MKRVNLASVKDQLSKYLRQAEKEEILITRHGKPAGVLIGFASEDDWFDYRLENDPRFLARIASAVGELKGRTGGADRKPGGIGKKMCFSLSAAPASLCRVLALCASRPHNSLTRLNPFQGFTGISAFECVTALVGLTFEWRRVQDSVRSWSVGYSPRRIAIKARVMSTVMHRGKRC